MIRNEWSCPQCLGETMAHCICIANQEAAKSEWKPRTDKDRRKNLMPRMMQHDVTTASDSGSRYATEILPDRRNRLRIRRRELQK